MELGPDHKQFLLSTFKYIDKLFADMEQVLAASPSPGLYEEYKLDVEPEKQMALRRAIIEFRELMSRIQKELNIVPPPPHLSAARAVSTFFTFIDIALEELQSKHMRGYGELSADSAVRLDAIVAEMRSMLEGMRDLREKTHATDG